MQKHLEERKTELWHRKIASLALPEGLVAEPLPKMAAASVATAWVATAWEHAAVLTGADTRSPGQSRQAKSPTIGLVVFQTLSVKTVTQKVPSWEATDLLLWVMSAGILQRLTQD